MREYCSMLPTDGPPCLVREQAAEGKSGRSEWWRAGVKEVSRLPRAVGGERHVTSAARLPTRHHLPSRAMPATSHLTPDIRLSVTHQRERADAATRHIAGATKSAAQQGRLSRYDTAAHDGAGLYKDVLHAIGTACSFLLQPCRCRYCAIFRTPAAQSDESDVGDGAAMAELEEESRQDAREARKAMPQSIPQNAQRQQSEGSGARRCRTHFSAPHAACSRVSLVYRGARRQHMRSSVAFAPASRRWRAVTPGSALSSDTAHADC